MHQRRIAFLSILINQNSMALAESATTRILTGKTHHITFKQQRAKGKMLGSRPVNIGASLNIRSTRFQDTDQF